MHANQMNVCVLLPFECLLTKVAFAKSVNFQVIVKAFFFFKTFSAFVAFKIGTVNSGQMPSQTC